MKIYISLLLMAVSLALGQSALGQDGPLQVEGPREVIPGQLVRLKAVTTAEESAFWIVLSPGDLDFEQVNNGRKLIFAADCLRRDPIVVMLLAQRVKDGRVITRQVRHEIKITGKQPAPPVKDPIPDDPAGSPLFAIVADGLSQMPQLAQERRTPVAANFELVAARCRSGQIVDVRGVWEGLSLLNHSAIYPHNADWEPMAGALQVEFKRLGLTSVAEHAGPLLVVASALKREPVPSGARSAIIYKSGTMDDEHSDMPAAGRFSISKVRPVPAARLRRAQGRRPWNVRPLIKGGAP